MKTEVGISREERGLPIRTSFEALRRELGFTQDEFGLQLGISKSLVQHYESGRAAPSPKTLKKMFLNAQRVGLILPKQVLDDFIEKKTSRYRDSLTSMT